MAEQEQQTEISAEAKSTLSAISEFIPLDKASEMAKEFIGIKPEEKAPPPEGKTEAAEAAPAPEKSAFEKVEAMNAETKLGKQEQDKMDGVIEIESDLFGGKKVIGGKVEVDMNDPKSIQDFVNKTLGIDSIEKFPSLVNGWRKDAQARSEAEKARSEAENLFTSLPSQLQNAIIQYNHGEDWMAGIVKSGSVDYSKNIDQYSSEQLVNAFYPGKFSREEWDAYRDKTDENKHLVGRIDDAIEMAKKEFKNNKSTIDNTRAQRLNMAEQRLNAMNTSMPRSEQLFSQTFPDAKPSVLDGLKKTISDGGVNQLFFNNDGSVKEDALVKLAYAEMGPDLFEQQSKALERATKNALLSQEIADKKAGIRSSGGAGSGGQSSEKTDQQKALEKIQGIFGTNFGQSFKF